ncbi:hypothetical protein [Epilithonimonas xixisoli]|uniref:Immunity protein 30 domain-containing protein n=1 Tax=Epilithonimonas xixisoli TaxID=1476462 RepID=A0A4V3H319_9FLAO|nr:hypothetical protein [Epilithonimonas xixisoli]TDX87291.1 hypothetical protein B0I22_1479 [Epilithonimonas xixisoli]
MKFKEKQYRKMDIHNIITQLNSVNPNNDTLYEVDDIISELYSMEKSERKKAIPAMFGIFERLNDNHYDSVLWSVLHAIEGLTDYENELIQSIERKPNEFNLLMVNRILNSGQTVFKDCNYIILLEKLLLDRNLNQNLNEDLKGYLEKHKGLK